MLFLASCPGNGGASDTSGTTYAAGGGGTPGAGGMTGQNNKEPSAWEAPCFVSQGEWEKPPSLAPSPLKGEKEGGGRMRG